MTSESSYSDRMKVGRDVQRGWEAYWAWTSDSGSAFLHFLYRGYYPGMNNYDSDSENE